MCYLIKAINNNTTEDERRERRQRRRRRQMKQWLTNQIKSIKTLINFQFQFSFRCRVVGLLFLLSYIRIWEENNNFGSVYFTQWKIPKAFYMATKWQEILLYLLLLLWLRWWCENVKMWKHKNQECERIVYKYIYIMRLYSISRYIMLYIMFVEQFNGVFWWNLISYKNK